MTPVQLDGAAVAITGAARGIGLATAKAFAAKGSRVFIGDLDAELATTEADKFGGRGFGLDVRSRASFAEFLDAVDGPLTVLVNNAGIMPAGAFADEDDAITDAILDINVTGVVIGTKLALRGMLERGTGHIVSVGSYLGKVPAAGLATYCASKHAEGVRGCAGPAGSTVAAAAEPREEGVLGILVAGLAVGRRVAPGELREQFVVVGWVGGGRRRATENCHHGNARGGHRSCPHRSR